DLQSWSAVAVDDAHILAKALPDENEVEALIVVNSEPDNRDLAARYGKRGQELYCIQDAWAVIENILVAIYALGFEAELITEFEREAVRINTGLSLSDPQALIVIRSTKNTVSGVARQYKALFGNASPESLLQAIQERRSTRSFTDAAIPQEALYSVIKASGFDISKCTMHAGLTYINNGDLERMYIFPAPVRLASAIGGQKFIDDAPIVLVYAVSDRTAIGDQARSIERTLLEAERRGLGAVWIGAFDTEALAKAMHIEERYIPVAVVPLGTRRDQARARVFKDNVFYNKRAQKKTAEPTPQELYQEFIGDPRHPHFFRDSSRFTADTIRQWLDAARVGRWELLELVNGFSDRYIGQLMFEQDRANLVQFLEAVSVRLLEIARTSRGDSPVAIDEYDSRQSQEVLMPGQPGYEFLSGAAEYKEVMPAPTHEYLALVSLGIAMPDIDVRNAIFFKRLLNAVRNGHFEGYFPGKRVRLARVESAGDADLHAYYQLDMFKYINASGGEVPMDSAEIRIAAARMRYHTLQQGQVVVAESARPVIFNYNPNPSEVEDILLEQIDKACRILTIDSASKGTLVVDHTKLLVFLDLDTGAECRLIYKPADTAALEARIIYIYQMLGLPGYPLYLCHDEFGNFAWVEYIDNLSFLDAANARDLTEQHMICYARFLALNYLLGGFDAHHNNFLLERTGEHRLLEIDREVSMIWGAVPTFQEYIDGIIELTVGSPQHQRRDILSSRAVKDADLIKRHIGEYALELIRPEIIGALRQFIARNIIGQVRHRVVIKATDKYHRKEAVPFYTITIGERSLASFDQRVRSIRDFAHRPGHAITAAGQFKAAKEYMDLSQQFSYIGKALLEIVGFARSRGEIEFKGGADQCRVAQYSTRGVVWDIVRSGRREDAHALIRQALENTVYDAGYIIAQIEVHESYPREEQGLAGQAEQMRQLIQKRLTAGVEGRFSKTKVAFIHNKALAFGKVHFTDIPAYMRSLSRRGYVNLQAIKIAQAHEYYSVTAMMVEPDCSVREAQCAQIAVDEHGFVRGTQATPDKRKQSVSLRIALMLQGHPEELEIAYQNGRSVVTTGRVMIHLSKFLSFHCLDPERLRIVLYMPYQGRRRIEFREKKGLGHQAGALLATVDVDDRSRPVGIPGNRTSFSLFEYLDERGRIDYGARVEKIQVRRTQDAFSTSTMQYVQVKRYFAFLEFSGIKHVVALEAEQSNSRLTILARQLARTSHGLRPEKFCLHTLTLSASGIPECMTGETVTTNPKGLLTILVMAGQIDNDLYAKFQKTRHTRRFNDARDVRIALRARRRLKGPESISVSALDRSDHDGGDRRLYWACLEYGVELVGTRRPWTIEETQDALNRLAALPGGEHNITPVALQRSRHWKEYYAANRLGIELPASERAICVLSPLEVRARLDQRRTTGGEEAITYTALAKSYKEGGDHQVLAAIRKLRREGVRIRLADGVELAAQARAQDPLLSSLNTYYSMEIPDPEYLSALWVKAVIHGDRASRDLFILGTLPLVRSVMETELRINLVLEGRSVALIHYLLTVGSVALFDNYDQWLTPQEPGTLVGFFRDMLEQRLRSAKKEFYAELEQLQTIQGRRVISLDQSRSGDEEETFTKDGLISRDISPVRAAIEAEKARLPLIAGEVKERLFSRLRQIFTEENLFTVFSNGKEYKWAIYVIGSLGRLGTAVQGYSDLNLVILSDASESFLDNALDTIARIFSAEVNPQKRELPTLGIGREGDYNDMLSAARLGRGRKSFRDFCLALNESRVGSYDKGFGTIEAVSVNGHDAGRRVHVRILGQVGIDGFEFAKGANGILLMESEEGVNDELRRSLLEKIQRATDLSP
ncbi:MAG: nitroreductase family protein, partial [Candidatus Omnitrophota bacterium]